MATTSAGDPRERVRDDMLASDFAVVGTVRQVWRFPVKSMRGERLERATITERGLVGDRAWALLDRATGKPVSAKRVQDFPNLMSFQAQFLEPPQAAGDVPAVSITLPDGSRASSASGEADRALSAWFGREVQLVPRALQASFVDAYPVSVLTTSTLARLEELAPGSRFDPRRFRMNLIIDTGAAGFVENGWIGHQLGVGEVAWLSVAEADARCVMTTLAQDDLPEDREIMRTLTRHNRLDVGAAVPQPCAGVYATVAVPGEVNVGEAVALD